MANQTLMERPRRLVETRERLRTPKPQYSPPIRNKLREYKIGHKKAIFTVS